MENRPTPIQLTPIGQYLRFAERGLCFDLHLRALSIAKIQEIGYYKLKEYSYFGAKYDNYGNLYYDHLTFYQVLARYYRDKDFRMELLEGIEDIEPFFINSIVSVLGEKYGAFGYLMFKNWVNRKQSKTNIIRQQQRFHRALSQSIKSSRLDDLHHPLKFNLSPNEDLPSIWLIGDLIPFGTAVLMLELMSTRNQAAVAKRFDCTPDELLSWMKTLRFIRNQCAHNHNLIDIQIKTKPIIPDLAVGRITTVNGKYSNKLAIALVIFQRVMSAVNPHYRYDHLNHNLIRLLRDEMISAESLGFIDRNAAILRRP